MLRVLVKKQLFEIFKSYFYDAKKNRARSKGATVAYLIFFAVLMVGLCGGIFTLVSLGLCVSMVSVGMDWLYFAIMGLMAVFLGAFGSVFNTYAGLYLAKDNDLLLSMPIPVRVIMTSRLLAVYLMGLMYSGVVMIPAVAVYLIFAPLTVSAVIGALLSVFLISVFVLTLSAALGWVVAKISLKLKNKSFITVIVSLVFIAAYYFFYSKAGQIITDLAEKGPCVIVGRCADYILQDTADCLKVFIHADMKFRAKRIVKVYGEREQSPEERLRDKDKRRAAYHRFYTNMKWGHAQNYHLTLDSGALRIDKCADIIVELF